MRNLLLGGKLLANECNEPSISLHHLRDALEFLQPATQKPFEQVCEHLGVDPEQRRSERFTVALLEKTAAQPRLPYSNDVLALLDQLQAIGLDMQSDISEPYINLHSRKGQYHTVVSTIAELKALLQSSIYDQNTAIEAVCDAAMRMSWSELSNRPQAIFSFMGPPATGKTFMAGLLAQGLQGYAFRSFDMTQYNSDKESFGLVGLRKGFTDAAEGELTDFVKQNPKSIIVFDELEKSHTRVQSALLKMLSEGVLRDEFSGEEIDFRQTIVVFTSNLGSALYTDRTFAELLRCHPHQAREQLLHAISHEVKIEDGHEVSAIAPEMASRLAQGSLVLFNRLSTDALSRIAKQQLQSEQKSFQDKLGLSVRFQDLERLAHLLVLGFAPNFDTRELKSRLTDYVYDPITDHLIANPSTAIESVELLFDNGVVDFLDAQSTEALTRQLSTKHQRVYFQHRIEQRGTTLSLTYCDARIEKLSRREDFEDASGIQIDLPNVRFDEIAGHSLIKNRLTETINLVRNRETLEAQGVSAPRGMLLYGVPGTGKTMLAKAFSHEADLPFIACSGTDLLSEEFIRKLFKRAREYAPAIIFIDEIDALPKRGSAGPHADALVNRMLIELDGFGRGDDIFIIAATNRKELIDPALLRSGRIDLHYEVPQLDKDARRWFIQQILALPLFAAETDVESLVMLTAGFSGADLEKVKRELVLLAIRENLTQIDAKRIVEQINTQKYGAPLTLEDSQQHLEETAYHEAAHAVLSRQLLPQRRIEQVTVVARADFLGMVSYDHDQQHDYTREFLFNLTCIALAGRAAQIKAFGENGLDSGAAGDLKQAANYAWHAVAEWGMEPELFNLSVTAVSQQLQHPSFNPSVETLIQRWLESATTHTQSLVEAHWSQIDAVAQQLLRDEVVTSTTLDQLMETYRNGH